MKCSRIALFLVLTALGWATMAPAANEGATDAAATTALPPLTHLDALHQTDLSESATDWRDDDLATDARGHGLNGAAETGAVDEEASPAYDGSNDSGYDHYYGSDAYRATVPGIRQSETEEEAHAGTSTTAEQSDVGSDAGDANAGERPNVESGADESDAAAQPNVAASPAEMNSIEQFMPDDAGESSTAEQSNVDGNPGEMNVAEQSGSDGDAGETSTLVPSTVGSDADESDIAAQPNIEEDADESDFAEQPNVEGNIGETDAIMQSKAESDAGEPNSIEQLNVEGNRGESNAAEPTYADDDAESNTGERQDADGVADDSDTKAGPAAAELNDGNSPQTSGETPSGDIPTYGESQAADTDGSEYASCRPAEKYASDKEQSVALSSAWAWLTDYAGRPLNNLRGAFRVLSRQIVRIDWEALLGGQLADWALQPAAPDEPTQP